MKKSYKASTGVHEFYYAVLTDDDDQSFTASEITRVKFLQNIEVEMPQEAMRAYAEASALRSNQRSNCTSHKKTPRKC
ncbi:hypothetical protein EI200_19665 [Peribacillus simplex]|uniref:major tail protein n=1 Tax=Peribacillus simplex TaxID=1478 RepID=UPI000F63BE5E|nr:major tail protein [Peribacillus simplex]RRN68438.1 hypothetical protein EI200_19665 [Peribacillus simplex]